MNAQQIEEILKNNGANNILCEDVAVEPITVEHGAIPIVPVAPRMAATNSSTNDSPIGQGIPPAALASDIGKVYLGMFSEYLNHRYGIHWPMTMVFGNDRKNPRDMTLLAPNPYDYRWLPTMDGPNHPGRYNDIHDTLLALAHEWSINIRLI